jgi:hypothetical protein
MDLPQETLIRQSEREIALRSLVVRCGNVNVSETRLGSESLWRPLAVSRYTIAGGSSGMEASSGFAQRGNIHDDDFSIAIGGPYCSPLSA